MPIDEREQELRRQENLDVLAKLRLLDDDFMSAVFQDNLACTDLVLRIIIGRPDIKTTKVITQDTLTNLQKRSVRLDIHAFAAGQEYNIEIQRAEKGASPRRARLNLSMMDANALLPGDSYEKLPESYVIFLTETDVLGLGLPLYVIERHIHGTEQIFADGTTILYVNCAYHDDTTPLGQLVHDFKCTKAEEMYYAELAERVRYFKEEPKGVAKMCEAIDLMAEKRAQRAFARGQSHGKSEGERKGKLDAIRALAKNLGISFTKAMDMMGLDAATQAKYLTLL